MIHPAHQRMRIPTHDPEIQLAITMYEGAGPALLLIHGITSSSAEFDEVIPSLVDICRPVTIDLRGHGNSDKPASGYHYGHYVSDLSAVIAELDLGASIVLGHSLGGIITMFWAAANPGVARALIIEDSPLRSGEDFRGAFEGWLTLNALPKVILSAYYADRHPTWSEAFLEARTEAMSGCARPAIQELMAVSMANEGLDSSDTLARIADPVLFLHGDPTTVNWSPIVGLDKWNPTPERSGCNGLGSVLHRA